MNRQSTKKDIEIPNKHIKSCLIFLVLREMQIKTKKTYHYTPIEIAKNQKTDTTKLLTKMCSNHNSHILLMEGEKCLAIWKTAEDLVSTTWHSFITLNVCLLMDFSIPLLDIYPSKMVTQPQ